MRHSSALLACFLLTLGACTPYTGTGTAKGSGKLAGTSAPALMQDEQPTRSACFWRFQTRPQNADDGPEDMIFALTASRHVARIQLDGTLYKLDIKSSVIANPLVYRSGGLSVEVTRKTSPKKGHMDAVLAITTPAGLSRVLPVTGKEECP